MKNKQRLVIALSLLCLLLAGCASSSAKEVEQSDAYTVYELSFERAGMRIYGELYLPNRDLERYPTVVISHGFESSYSYTAAYAEYLANAGIAAYVFDFCGGSSHSRSDGSMKEMSVLTECADLNAVLDEILSLDFVDSTNLFLMGESQGGLVSSLVAADRAEDIKGLVLFYPALVIPDHARGYFPDGVVPDNPAVMGGIVGGRYFRDVISMNVFEEIVSYDKDVLIVHGTSDSVVPISYSERAIATYNSAELLAIEGAGHGFYGSDLDEACNRAVDFIESHIN